MILISVWSLAGEKTACSAHVSLTCWQVSHNNLMSLSLIFVCFRVFLSLNGKSLLKGSLNEELFALVSETVGEVSLSLCC